MSVDPAPIPVKVVAIERVGPDLVVTCRGPGDPAAEHVAIAPAARFAGLKVGRKGSVRYLASRHFPGGVWAFEPAKTARRRAKNRRRASRQSLPAAAASESQADGPIVHRVGPENPGKNIA
jgi:hypothetical protein